MIGHPQTLEVGTEEHYRLLLNFEETIFSYFDEASFPTYNDALAVAKYVAENGYPYGDSNPARKVIKVRILKEVEVGLVPGKNYEEYKDTTFLGA